MKCGLLGEKLGNSYSPELHAFFGDYDYDLFEVPPEDLGSFLKTQDFQGLNVTIPYKTTLHDLCDYLTEAARSMIGFAFRTFGVRDFSANHATGNPASGHVMRRCGMVFDHEGEYARFDGSEVFPADFYRLHLDRSGRARRYRFDPMEDAWLTVCRGWGYPLPCIPVEHRFAVLDEADQLAGAAWYLPEEGALTMFPALSP